MQLPVPERFEREDLAVLVAGTTTMGIEILAGRILAPQFGSSIYTWGSIIGVFMAALSLGYYVGGKRAERHASYRSVAGIMLESAAFIAFLLLFADEVMVFARALPIGARYAALLPVTILFGPAVFLLGFITPYAAELSKESGTGAASGHVFAIGTIGSIIGAFAATFVLIPSLPVATIELLFGGLLVLGALFVGFRRFKGALYPLGMAVLLVVAFVMHGNGAVAGGQGELVHKTQTPYQQLEIREDNGVRTMYLNGQPQSAMYVNGSTQHVWKYTQYFHLPFLVAENPDEIDRVLFIGGGGFTGPKRFAEAYDVTVDVVEIDPSVVHAAKQYFDVQESEQLNIHTMDGRAFLQQTDHTYDVIVLDAYRKSSVPFHLTTQEFMHLASDKMDKDGMLVANLISTPDGPGSRFYRAEYRTMQTAFPQVYAFPTSSSTFSQNIELLATKQIDQVSLATLQERNRERDIGINLSRELAAYHSTVDTGDAPVLTDEQAPVDKLLDPLLGRKYVIEE